MSWDDADVGVLPAGTVTLLLADIEGSTRLWETRSSEMPDALAGLDSIVEAVVTRFGGVRPVEQGEGDSFVAAFSLATDALACALELQRATAGGLLRLRMGLHTGDVQQNEQGLYMGPTINRTARIRDAGHGGQVLVSQSTADLVLDQLPAQCSLVDLGSCRLRDLGRPIHLWQLGHPALPTAFPPLRGLASGRNNLPLQLTSFVGRGAAVTQLHDVLSSDRAVTLTGAGGCGKTRLALQVASERVDQYAGGVWFVDFAPVNEAAAVGALIADAVGASPRPGQPPLTAISDAIGELSTLLVLDNCEHLVTECAEMVEAMLRACRAITVLATSREPLGFAGEVTFRVPSLSAPGPEDAATAASLQQFDAVALFVERARRARSRFGIDETNASAIGEICRRLDGIPLAIELAAARMRVLTPEQIRDGLHDRFRLLTGGARTAVPRHQTLQASVDWSYALLLGSERLLLCRLSVFAGGFTLDAAASVGSGGDLEPHHIFDLLTQLVDKSLLVTDEEGGGHRFGMLETVRQYAAARMVDSGTAIDVRRRHFDFFSAFSRQRAGETTDCYRRRLDDDYDNLRRALQWADDQDDPEPLVRFAASLYGYWALGRRVGEAHQWLGHAVDRATAPSLRARVLGHFAHIHGMAVSWAEAAPMAEEAVALARAGGSSRSLAWSLGQLSNALANIWRTEEAEAALDEAITIAEASGDVHGQAFALFQRGRMKAVSEPRVALAALHDADRLAASIGAEYLHHMSKACMAWSFAELGDLHAAVRSHDEAAEGLRAIGDGWFFSSVLAFAAYTKAAVGDDAGAVDALSELAALSREVGFAVRGSAALGPGVVAVITGAWDDGISWLDQVEGVELNVACILLTIARVQTGDVAGARALIAAAETGEIANLTRGVALCKAEVAFAAGDLHIVQDRTRDFLLDHTPLLMAPLFEIHALQLFAAAAAGLDRHDEAIRMFAAAGAQCDRIGMSKSTALARLFDPYLVNVRAAVETHRFDELSSEGSALPWKDVIAYLGRGRGQRRRPRSGWDSLTPTERQVVSLVVAGLPNKGIGERLLMSIPTVKSHLTHTYAKVGVSSRSELIAAANGVEDALFA